jgi:AcrR family transcriptional regulator
MVNKNQILKEAAKLFIRYGIKTITMDDVATQLHVSKRTLYELFNKKHDLIDEIVSSHIKAESELLMKLISESENAIDIMLKSSKYILHMYSKLRPSVLFDLKRYYPDIWKKVEHFNNDYIRQMIEKNLIRGIEENVYRKDIEPNILSTFYILQLHIFSDESNENLNEFEFGELTKQFFNYHLHGIMSQKGLEYFKNKENNYL